METTFKYQGKIISTPNLEKKLKRMKISIDDVEIIDTPVKKKESPTGVEDYMLNKRQVVVRSTEDDIRRICYVKKGERPPIKDILNNLYSEKELMTMYYEN